MIGRCVVVTGAGRGLGRAMAEAFLGQGATLHAIDKEPALAEGLRADLASFGSRLNVRCLDVRDEPGVSDFFAALPQLDILVNSAGIAAKRSFLETSSDEFDTTMQVNLRAAFIVMREAARAMAAHRGGHIINIVSDAGLVGMPGMADYSASKHAVMGLTRAARHELRRYGIRLTALCPGSIRTDIFGTGSPNPLAMSTDAVARFVLAIAQMPPEIEIREVLLEPMTLVEERRLVGPEGGHDQH